MGKAERCSERKVKPCIICGCILNNTNTTWYRQKNYIHKCNSCMRTEKRNQAKSFRNRNPKLSASRSIKCRQKLKAENPITYTAQQQCGSARKRANALGISYNLSPSYIVSISPVFCPILGMKLKFGGGTKTNSSSSIDRIDPARGYVVGNVQVVSNLANTMKSNATTEQLIMFSKWIKTNNPLDFEKVKGVSREK